VVKQKGLQVRYGLSKDQEQVLFYLTKEFLTPTQIAYRRGTTYQAVSKLISKLRKKGYLEGGLKKAGRVSVRTPKHIKKMWELHALHFIIKPYYFYPRYDKIRKEKGNYGIHHREWTIMLHPDSVRIQSKEKVRFIHEDKDKAIAMTQESFNRLIYEIQNRYGFQVWKDKKANIKLVNHHLARSPSEVADSREGKENLSIKGYDGKIWLLTDKSKLAEHEYTHPENAYDDSEKIEPYLNDMLYNKPPTISDLAIENNKIMNFVLKSHAETIKTQEQLSINIKEHIKLMKNVNKAVNKLNKVKKEQKMYETRKEQESLRKWV